MKRPLAVALSAALLAVGCVNVTPSPTPTLGPTPTPGSTGVATASPSVAPSNGPSASPTSAPETPHGTLDPALVAEIDAVTAGVPAVRELPPTADVPFEFITRDQFRNDLLALNDEDAPPEVRAAEERLLKRLGLLPADADLDALIVELYGAQVAAYYRPDTKRFYIIERDQPFGASDKIVVAHEYTHALQDQHFDLDANTIKDPHQGDAQLAQLAVIEGDATLSSQLWATQNLSSDELFELLTEALGSLEDQQALAGMPLVLRRQLEFPYTEGFLFVNELYNDGGFDAVNAAIQTPPASTEQILQPEKYSAGEAPIAVDAPDLLGVLGNGWYDAYEQTLGELGIQIFATGGEEPELNIPGLPVDWPHQEVAAGWGGDRLRMYENTDGRWTIAWQTAWDTQADADEFAARVAELQSTFAGPAQLSEAPNHVEVAITGDAATLNLLP